MPQVLRQVAGEVFVSWWWVWGKITILESKDDSVSDVALWLKTVVYCVGLPVFQLHELALNMACFYHSSAKNHKVTVAQNHCTSIHVYML